MPKSTTTPETTKHSSPVQVALTLDATASMSSALQAAKEGLSVAGEAVKTACQGADPAMALTIYFDYSDQGKDLSAYILGGGRGSYPADRTIAFSSIYQCRGETTENYQQRLTNVFKFNNKEDEDSYFTRVGPIANQITNLKGSEFLDQILIQHDKEKQENYTIRLQKIKGYTLTKEKRHTGCRRKTCRIF